MRTIWWIRRDLRLNANAALKAALQSGGIIPVFIRDPGLLDAISGRRQAFLWEGLAALEAVLRQKGSRLILRTGSPEFVLRRVLTESGADTVFAEEDYTPYARQRDTRLSASLPLRLIQGQLVHHPAAAMKADGNPYQVFTPFSRNWLAILPNDLNILPAPERLPAVPDDLGSEEIPSGMFNPLFPAGEQEARKRLFRFTAQAYNQSAEPALNIYNYHECRNRMDLDGTALLSPYFHFGMLALREAVHLARQALASAPDEQSRKGASSWLNELIWREFYIHILYHFPRVRRGSFRQKYDHIRWENNEADFKAWKNGQTGYPVVDAAMRQLRETGWMHNRARMLAASFLVKDLLIDWRWGEAWFMEQLLDADIAANNGGWQWTAGVGTDAAPYFRIFNLVTQSRKFDPNGDYIRKWVPELAHLAGKAIHAPWEHADAAGYPLPIIDHKFARQRTLEAYKSIP